jgi:hypothetical protein
MTTITRCWLAFAAIGTGLVHVALVGGAPLPLGVVLGLIGLIEFGWGVLTFARDDIAHPAIALAGAVSPVIAWGLLLVAATASRTREVAAALPLIPLLIATLFELFIAVTIAIHLRRVAENRAAPRVRGMRTKVLAVVAGGLVVTALTASALAAAQAAVPPGSNTGVFDPAHEH